MGPSFLAAFAGYDFAPDCPIWFLPILKPMAGGEQGRSQEVDFFIITRANYTNLYKNLIKI